MQCADCSACSANRPPLFQFIADYNGEDHFLTRIGHGGLINLDKVYRTQAVMDRIACFHQHYHARLRDPHRDPHRDHLSIHTASIERGYLVDDTEDRHYALELDTYRPVQSLAHDHGVSLFPISNSGIDHHVLQILHHGTTSVHWESEVSRTALVYVRLERSCATLTWGRPSWSGLSKPGGSGGGSSGADYSLSANPEDAVAPALASKLGAVQGEVAGVALEEGYLDLVAVKEIALGVRDKDKEPDLTNALKRYGMERLLPQECCLALVFGTNLSDNRVLYLVCPPRLCRMWFEGLSLVVRGIKRQMLLTDRRMLWLKEQYLQLYYDENCSGPMVADAIRVFGGRDWTLAGTVSRMSPPDNGTLRRGASIKFKKKKSISNIPVLKDLALKQTDGDGVIGSHLRRPGAGSSVAASGGPSPTPGAGIAGIAGIAGMVHANTPSRSRSISSDMEVRPGAHGAHGTHGGHAVPSPQGSSDNLDKISNSPTHHSLHRGKTQEPLWRHLRLGSITHETQLDFADYVSLFRSFSVRSRKDLRDLFDKHAVTCRSMSDSSLNDASAKSSPDHQPKPPQRIGEFCSTLLHSTGLCPDQRGCQRRAPCALRSAAGKVQRSAASRDGLPSWSILHVHALWGIVAVRAKVGFTEGF